MMKTSKTTAKRFQGMKLRASKRIGTRASNFADDESGVLIGFGVFLLLMILAVGGIGVDLMRFEYTRTSLQSTLDRAVLAAADLDQSLDAQFVVEDYFDKSNLGEYLKSVTVDEGVSHKQVDATAEIEMGTQLIHMLGVPVLNARAAGAARESIGAVEISMILDMSGSMGGNNKLNNLKVAAKDFVDLVIDNSNHDDVSISIVPYAEQVSLGKDLMDQYTVSQEHDYSYCIDFLADEFNSTDISTTFEWQRTAHFDPWSRPYGSTSDGYRDVNIEADGQTLKYPVCPTNQNTRIMPFSNNADALKAHIQGLSAGGNTSIDLGMKWGVALLDPAAQPVVSGLIDEGEVNSVFEGRPKIYDPANNLKIAIVMTDGENTTQHYILPPYRDGMTDVWRHNSGTYSLRHDNEWYYNDSWHDAPYKDSNGQGSHQLSYPELFARMPLEFNARENWAEIEGTTPALEHWRDNLMNTHNSSYKDQRLDRICKAAKAQGIIVFTIAFEAPRNGKRVLNKCASSDGHYFEAEGLDIEDAFVSIASSISKLRLIQ